MESRNILRVVIKLVGFAVFLFGLIQATSSLPLLLELLGNETTSAYGTSSIVAYITPILLGLLLWLLPSTVASTVIQPELKADSTPELLAGLESIALRLMGFYLLYTCLSSLLSTYIEYYQALEASGDYPNFYGKESFFLVFSVLGLELLMSIYLIFGAKTITKFIRKLKYAS